MSDSDNEYDGPRVNLGEKGGLLDKIFPETLKKVFMLGAGTIFMTEEAIRAMVGEMRLPRDVAEYLATQGGKSKKELFKLITREVVAALEKIDYSSELQNVLDNYTVEIKAEFSFSRKDDKSKSDKQTVKVRRTVKTAKKKK
jgi:polyhydroxyalkanoate synthesis regulator phasin